MSVDGDLFKQMASFVKKSQNHKGAQNALDLLRPYVAISCDSLDVEPYLFNVDNGTIDLMTGRLRPHDPKDHLTKLSPATYDPDAKCPQWQQFLIDIFGDDDELIQYVQRVPGYTLLGQVSEHILLFMFGSGANGKTTLMDVLLGVFGEYGGPYESSILMASPNNSEDVIEAIRRSAHLSVEPIKHFERKNQWNIN